MELSDFIAGTLAEIMRGVSKAAKSHDSIALGGSIAPVPDSLRRNYASLPIREVEFDVAVTVEKTSEKLKSGGVNIKVIEADLTSNALQKTVGESRVKFSVPVCLPSTSLTDQ